MVLDVREVGDDITKLAVLALHGKAIVDVLYETEFQKQMNPGQWQSDVNAFGKISIPSESQMDWVEKVLSDPLAGKSRLANSRIS